MDVQWRKLLEENPIISEAFDVALRTTMQKRLDVADTVAQALHNAKRDGTFEALSFLEHTLSTAPVKPESKTKKGWDREKLHNEHRSSDPVVPTTT